MLNLPLNQQPPTNLAADLCVKFNSRAGLKKSPMWGIFLGMSALKGKAMNSPIVSIGWRLF